MITVNDLRSMIAAEYKHESAEAEAVINRCINWIETKAREAGALGTEIIDEVVEDGSGTNASHQGANALGLSVAVPVPQRYGNAADAPNATGVRSGPGTAGVTAVDGVQVWTQAFEVSE